MILKKKICKVCETEQYLFSRGRCKSCTAREDFKPLKRTEIIKKPYVIPKQTQRNKDKRKVSSEIRNVYFEHHISLCRVSEESGTYIPEPWRGNICHLFDKGRHPSLQGNLDNCIYLTLDEHTEFDRLLYSHEFEALELKFSQSWEKTCEKFKALLPLCLEKTKFYFKVEEYLNSKL